MQSSGFRVQGSRCRAQGSGLMVQGAGFRFNPRPPCSRRDHQICSPSTGLAPSLNNLSSRWKSCSSMDIDIIYYTLEASVHGHLRNLLQGGGLYYTVGDLIYCTVGNLLHGGGRFGSALPPLSCPPPSLKVEGSGLRGEG